MKGKVAIVTGGMGGLGEAISKALAKQGATVVATYYRNNKNHESAKTWEKELQAAGLHNIHAAYVDVRDFNSCKDLILQTEERFGEIGILVNNAGITDDSSFKKMSQEQWRNVISTDLDSVFNMTQPVINNMLKQQYGRIINISSINGQKGQFGQCNYAAAKAGIHGFTKSLAREVMSKGITVNTISPGYLLTKMVEAIPDNIKSGILAEIPAGRFGAPDEVADLVCFLAKEATRYITGANIPINGGHYLS